MSTDTSTFPPVRAEDAQAITSVVGRLVASWARHDAETMAGLYEEDASVILPGEGAGLLKGRDAIARWMAAAFAGKWKGTRVMGTPLELRYIADDLCLLISQGGAYRPGDTEVSVNDAIRALWIFRRVGDVWSIVSYANTPAGTTIPVPAATATS